MRKVLPVAMLFAILLHSATMAQDSAFHADSAYLYLSFLSDSIGPRPMGSRQERQALAWAAAKFAGFGADTSYVMPLFSTITATTGVNTHSGVAVGIFRGETDSTIVIGGHIDSSGPEIPGANDDASGIACVLELARIWKNRPRHYTLLFAAFGGEEGNLVGSRFFVANYPDLEKIVLMLQIDMAGSEDVIVPFLETRSHQAPIWLVEDAFAFDRSLGYNSIDYPTHFFSLNNAMGGAGSDHQPFLEKDIPAIDFTAGINESPIHTPQDRIAHISKPMLARSGRLVHALLEKYQSQGIPAERENKYMLLQALGGRIYIPAWAIIGLDALAVVLGLFAFARSRMERLRIPKNERARFPGLKLALLTLVIAVFLQLGEALMQWLKALRHPWMVPFDQYIWLAAFYMAAGAWLAFFLARNWRFSPDHYVYAKRALILLFIYSLLFGLASARMALYPAMSLLLFSLAILIPIPWLEVLLCLLAPYPLIRLLLMDPLPFIGRNLAMLGLFIDSFGKSLLQSAVLTLIFFFLLLPFLFVFGYMLRRAAVASMAFRILRRPASGALLLLAIAVYSGYLYALPAYNALWRPIIRVQAKYDMRTMKPELTVMSNEYLKETTVQISNTRQTYDGRTHKVDLDAAFVADWLRITGTERATSPDRDTLDIDWTIFSEKPLMTMTLSLRSDSLGVELLQANHSPLQKSPRIVFKWQVTPQDSFHLRVLAKVPAGRRLIRTLEATYAELPIAAEVTSPFADVIYRTTVSATDTLNVPAADPVKMPE